MIPSGVVQASAEMPQGLSASDQALFRRAQQGDAEAQSNLGFMYLIGRGVPEDDAEAVKWYRKAAEQGYALAHCSLGYMHEVGDGVAKDATEAAKWYRKAAEQVALRSCSLSGSRQRPFTPPGSTNCSSALKWSASCCRVSPALDLRDRC